jgi:hypothetical protein
VTSARRAARIIADAVWAGNAIAVFADLVIRAAGFREARPAGIARIRDAGTECRSAGDIAARGTHFCPKLAGDIARYLRCNTAIHAVLAAALVTGKPDQLPADNIAGERLCCVGGNGGPSLCGVWVHHQYRRGLAVRELQPLCGRGGTSDRERHELASVDGAGDGRPITLQRHVLDALDSLSIVHLNLKHSGVPLVLYRAAKERLPVPGRCLRGDGLSWRRYPDHYNEGQALSARARPVHEANDGSGALPVDNRLSSGLGRGQPTAEAAQEPGTQEAGTCSGRALD